MEKSPINKESEGDSYASLKKDLLNNVISFDELRDKVMAWDQATPTRDASKENLHFLLDQEIVEYIDKHPEAQSKYQDLLSLTEFHVAQGVAFADPLSAINHFEKALESARQGTLYESWIAYVEGTLLYMEGKQIPEELIEKAESTRNAQILRNFNNGLRERGTPSYFEDYSK